MNHQLENRRALVTGGSGVEIASLAAWLAVPEASYVIRTSLSIDGGVQRNAQHPH